MSFLLSDAIKIYSKKFELKALNIIKSLVISSTRNKTGINLGWFFVGFFRWVYPIKTRRVFSGIYPGFWTLKTNLFRQAYTQPLRTLV